MTWDEHYRTFKWVWRQSHLSLLPDVPYPNVEAKEVPEIKPRGFGGITLAHLT